MAVSKRLRFEILRRDNHQCRYCGARGEETPLTVDHVTPEALGGTDDPANLVAACADCNAGKSSVPPGAPLVEDVSGTALRWSAAIKRAAEELATQNSDRSELYAAFKAEWYQGNLPADWTETIDRFLNAGLPIETVLRMAKVAQNKRGAMGYRWAYFCGCCWNRVRDLQDRALELLAAEEGRE